MKPPYRLAHPLLIRSARRSEAAALHAACFPDQARDWVEDYLRWCLAEPGRPARLVALLGETLVAHAELMPRQGGAWAELSSLVVAAPHRGQGIGRRMVGAAERLARRWGCTALRLQVLAREQALIAMYEQWGFQRQGRPIHGRLWLVRPIALPTAHPAAREPVKQAG